MWVNFFVDTMVLIFQDIGGGAGQRVGGGNLGSGSCENIEQKSGILYIWEV